MPNYIKSGKYYYEVDKRDGKKLRISKDKYDNLSNKKIEIKNVKKTIVKKVNQKVNPKTIVKRVNQKVNPKTIVKRVNQKVNPKTIVKRVNQKVNQKVNIDNDQLNVSVMIKDKLKNMDKNKALENLIRLHFNTTNNNKLYHVDAELGRCPRTGYYIYRVDVQYIPKNGMNHVSAYSSHMVSSNKQMLKNLL